MDYDALERMLRKWAKDMRLFGNADQCVREAADAIADLRARNEALVKALESTDEWLKHTPLESGYCCCGDPMEGHHYSSGHAPVDDLAYSAATLQDEIRAALAANREG